MINTSMGQRLEQRPELRQHLAPRMIHSMEILQMPVQALQERIEQELNENPVLERRDAAEEGQEGESQPEEPGPAEEFDPDGVLVHDPDNQADFNRLDALNRDWDDLFNEEHRPSRAGLAEEGDRKHDAMQNMPARPMSLQEYLEDQVGFLEITPEQERLVRFVIGHIDRSGYLGERYLDERDQEHLRLLTCSELARRYDGAVTADEVEEALLLVQKLDPPGVGARDLKECLLLQLQPDTPHRDVVRALILHHLEDIQHNRLPVIQKKTGFDLPVVKEAIDILARFDPEPGSRFDSAQTQYVVPDLLVERTDSGDYEVRLTDEWMPSLRISRSYYQMARDKAADPKTKDYLRRKILSAQWLLEAIDQRRNTLLKVTRAIIDRQRAFLDKGPEYIEP
ncbi:MAG TPA: RNA polymerase sigma-54 factor, partial [Gemmataceae bacterium]